MSSQVLVFGRAAKIGAKYPIAATEAAKMNVALRRVGVKSVPANANID